MAGQVVLDDGVAGLEFGNEELFDVGSERDLIAGPSKTNSATRSEGLSMEP